MNTGLVLRSVHQAINSIVPKVLTVGNIPNILANRIHYVFDRQKLNHLPNLSGHTSTSTSTSTFLQPVLPIYITVCGLKAKGRLQLRCKDCYFETKNERQYVMCKTHPRHKQVKTAKKLYKTWILTWASQSKVRGW